MIAVIADDLTGAAELAGIGLDYHLKTEVNTVVDLNSKADLLIVTMNSRGLPEAEAKALSKHITTQLMKLQPELIYKKIDSVLRGNVIKEVEGQLEASKLKRALIIPGNPLHEKTVVNGIYFYQGKPVHESAYAIDPEYPATSPEVKQMLRAGKDISLLKVGEWLPENGIAVGDIAHEEDYQHWIDQLDEQTILAGASGLFEALLKGRYAELSTVKVDEAELRSPRLFVLGSTFHQGRERPEAGFSNIAPNFLPANVAMPGFVESVEIEGFVNGVVKQLGEGKDIIIAIYPGGFYDLTVNPKLLATNMAVVVEKVLAKVVLSELLIEGGATGAAIIARLGITRMQPQQHISPGVIRLSVPGNNQLHITLKPGSYQWPALTWA